MSEEELIKQLKGYYYTTLSSYEIRERLGINTTTYNRLLKKVKKELGISDETYRTPRKFNKYHDGCYMIINTLNDNVQGYYPTLESALLKNSEINNPDFIVKKITDSEMIELIKKYYDEDYSWDKLQSKFKLPYHKLYNFIHTIKEELHLTKQYRINNPHRYIYLHKNGRVFIRKRINGKASYFGYYKNYDEAIPIRNYLESIGWDYDLWLSNKDMVKESLLGHA